MTLCVCLCLRVFKKFVRFSSARLFCFINEKSTPGIFGQASAPTNKAEINSGRRCSSSSSVSSFSSNSIFPFSLKGCSKHKKRKEIERKQQKNSNNFSSLLFYAVFRCSKFIRWPCFIFISFHIHCCFAVASVTHLSHCSSVCFVTVIR